MGFCGVQNFWPQPQPQPNPSMYPTGSPNPWQSLSEAGREACWLKNLFDELEYPQESPIIIKGDNDGSVSMARSQQFHNRSKHIAIRWHWVRELVEQHLLQIDNCRDPQQTADILTKALLPQKHNIHTYEMGLSSTWGGVLGGKSGRSYHGICNVTVVTHMT